MRFDGVTITFYQESEDLMSDDLSSGKGEECSLSISNFWFSTDVFN